MTHLKPRNDRDRATAHFANQDGADRVIERLRAAPLKALREWFREKDGSGGRVLVEHAPLFDAGLQELVDEAAKKGGARTVQQSLFGLGLSVGATQRDLGDGLTAEGIADATSIDLEAILERLAEFELPPGTQPMSGSAEDYGLLTANIEEHEPRLPIVLRAIWSIENLPIHSHLNEEDGEIEVFCNSRFAFFAGLVAAGIDI